MTGAINAHHDCIKALPEEEFTEDLKINVPVLVMQGDDDQILPIADSAERAITRLRHGTLTIYMGYRHGMWPTHAEVFNRGPVAFVRG